MNKSILINFVNLKEFYLFNLVCHNQVISNVRDERKLKQTKSVKRISMINKLIEYGIKMGITLYNSAVISKNTALDKFMELFRSLSITFNSS